MHVVLNEEKIKLNQIKRERTTIQQLISKSVAGPNELAN